MSFGGLGLEKLAEQQKKKSTRIHWGLAFAKKGGNGFDPVLFDFGRGLGN